MKRFEQNLQAKFPSLLSSSSSPGESPVVWTVSSEAALSLSLSWSELTGESMLCRPLTC